MHHHKRQECAENSSLKRLILDWSDDAQWQFWLKKRVKLPNMHDFIFNGSLKSSFTYRFAVIWSFIKMIFMRSNLVNIFISSTAELISVFDVVHYPYPLQVYFKPHQKINLNNFLMWSFSIQGLSTWHIIQPIHSNSIFVTIYFIFFGIVWKYFAADPQFNYVSSVRCIQID